MLTYIFLVLSLVLFSNAKSFEFKESSGSTIFKATALGLKFDGKGTGPFGVVQIEDTVFGELEVNLDSLDTGIDLRNTHMKENYLETKKFPRGKLFIDNVEGFNLSSSDGNYKFSGRIVVHGAEKPIESASVLMKKTPSGYEIEAKFETKISDFSIPLPKYAGLALKDNIQVVVKATAVEK